MKTSKKTMIISICSIAILLASVVMMLLDLLIPLKFWIHPALTLLFFLCIGFGIMTLVLGFTEKSPWYFFISATTLGLALLYALYNLIVFWWVALIVMVVLWIIIALFSIMRNGNQTENIALNKSTDYKDYKQRKAEKEEAEQAKEPEKMPEIKSFKD